jgi:hypothetical protein
MSNIKSLEELTFNEAGKIVDGNGKEVTATPIGVPVVIQVNYRARYERDEQNDNYEIKIWKSAPDSANAYMKGELRSAAVVRGPYWDDLPVQFYWI